MSALSLFDRLLAGLARGHAQHQFRKFVRAALTARRTQERVLHAKLAKDADSAFGREHGFAQIRSYRDFINRVPVRTYEDLRPYVERVMAGETTALLGSGRRVLMFAMTSGSVDKPKYVPITPEFLREYRRGWNVFGIKALLDHPGAFLRPILQVSSPAIETRTEHGIPCGSISGLLADTQKRLVRRFYVCPPEVRMIGDPEARYYTIMRLAVPRDVGWMVTASPATQLRLARTASSNAERLIRDVRDGTLQAPGEVPEPVRRAIASKLQPEPDTARRLERLAKQHGELLPRHFWNLAFLANWTGGTMGLHLQDFPGYFGDTPVRDIGLLATEGRVSIPLADGTPAGVLDVTGGFFEFIDADADARCDAAIHRCHELKPGNEYRVLMTTSAGFYRYDIGDHVRVHDYVGEAPVIEFLHRGAHVSSVTGEKLTERQVVAAFERASGLLGLHLDNFVLAPVWANPPFYRLHLEASSCGTGLQPVCFTGWKPVPQGLAELLDEELSRANVEYGSKRSSGRLGAIALIPLPPGTLDRFDAHRLSRRGASNEQYKHQYLLTKPGQDALLTPGE